MIQLLTLVGILVCLRYFVNSFAIKEKYIVLSTGLDKRTKILSLTKKGQELENKLSTIQINKIKEILKNADQNNINGFKIMLYEMIDNKNKNKFDKLNY